MRGPSSRVRKNIAKGVLPLGILASAGVVWQSSYAAFSGTTANGGNTWTAGTVNLTNNGAATGAINIGAMKPGTTGTACIKVTYTGSLASKVNLYVLSGDLTTSTSPNNLGKYLTFKVDEGTGSAADCSDFTMVSNDYNPTTSTASTLSTFAAAATNFGTGVSGWTATTTQTRDYRFTWTLQDDNNAQGLNAAVKLTWEAQNS